MTSCVFGMWLLATVLSVALIATCESANYRLSVSVRPSYYNLSIGLHADGESLGNIFDGEVAITLRATKRNVNRLRLHMDSLDIESCSLSHGDGKVLENIVSSRLIHDRKTQQLAVHLTEYLIPDQSYILHLKYTGKVRTDMAGLFFASYAEAETGRMKWFVSTQMQRLNARLVFPCFDEPALKAKFELHIARPKHYNAISNTNLISTADGGNGRQVDHFEATPVMSTYLLAFMITEYQARGNLSEFAVVTRPEYYNFTEFSYSVAQNVLPAYDELFQKPYRELGNGRLLHASSPRFPHNGMENWGLIIYRDNILVQHPGYTDGWTHKELTTRTIVHETAHMWFGDSVTFEWWSYFWLNEAFARYFEYFMTHQLNPEYQLDQQFVVRQMQLIFGTDSNASSQPMTSPAKSAQTPPEIAKMFSSIAYAKGASIVRMWRNLMGGDNFDKSIRSYLKQHHLSNTEPKDFFEHLKQNWPTQQHVDLDQFFLDFTEQVGYPVVTVHINHGKIITLQQTRFLSNHGDGSNASIRYTVPITFATNLSPNFQNLTPVFYFNKSSEVEVLYFDDSLDWIVLNLQQSNYYRVFYETSLLHRIQSALVEAGHSDIAVENRAQIIDDLFNFASTGLIDYEVVFQFLEYLSKEIDYIPWYATYEGMKGVARRFTPQQRSNFEKYLEDTTAGVFAKLGVSWSVNDTVLDVYNRNMMVSWICKYHHPDCNQNVQKTLKDKQEAPSPDYRETFYCAASRSGSYDLILEFYHQETHYLGQELLWRAASCTSDYRTHYQNEILGKHNSVAFKSVGLAQLYEQNPELVTPVFVMVTENITQLAEALDSWPRTAQALSDLAKYFTTRKQQKLLSDFYDANYMLFGTSLETLTKALTTVDKNLKWAEEHLSGLGNYLSKRNGAGGLAMASMLLLIMPIVLQFFLISECMYV